MSVLYALLLMVSGMASAGGHGSISWGRPSPLGDLKGSVEGGRQSELVVGGSFDPVVVGLLLRHAVHSGCNYELQAVGCAAQGPGPFIQGDLVVRTTGARVGLPTLVDADALKVGLDFSLGVVRAPLLMDEDYYAEEVVNDTWGGVRGSYHDGFMPFLGAGFVLARPLPPLVDGGSAPELFLKVETSWAGALGAQLTPSAGARVRFGD